LRTENLVRKEDLCSKEEQTVSNHWIYRFPNNYGASVVKVTRPAYDGPLVYEVTVICFIGDTNNAYEVMMDEVGVLHGYFDEKGVDRFLKKISRTNFWEVEVFSLVG
jgi:hypothetical protein